MALTARSHCCIHGQQLIKQATKGMHKCTEGLHNLLTHLVFPSLNLIKVKQDATPIPVVLVTFYLLVAFVAEIRSTCGAGHLVAAFTSLNGHATCWTLLTSSLQK